MIPTEVSAVCVRCGEFATFDSPDDLCQKHWHEWMTEGYTSAELVDYYEGWIEQTEEDASFYQERLEVAQKLLPDAPVASETP